MGVQKLFMKDARAVDTESNLPRSGKVFIWFFVICPVTKQVPGER